MSSAVPSPYQSLEDESISYMAWVFKHSARFRCPEWLAEDSLTSIPPRVRALMDRNNSSDGSADLKVYIGRGNESYSPFYLAGAIQLPLDMPGGIAVRDISGFMDRLRESGTVYRHATITPVEVNGPVPPVYTLATRDAPVPTVTVTALSSGFADATNKSAWTVGCSGAFGSISFYLELVHRRSTLVGVKVDACIELERCTQRAKARALEVFNGPRPCTTAIHCGESLGFLCARYRKATEEVVLHLSQSELSTMNATFPILGTILSSCTRTQLATECFYDIPFKPLSWTSRSDTWIGRVRLNTFVSTTAPEDGCGAAFLLLSAVYIDL